MDTKEHPDVLDLGYNSPETDSKTKKTLLKLNLFTLVVPSERCQTLGVKHIHAIHDLLLSTPSSFALDPHLFFIFLCYIMSINWVLLSLVE